MACLHCLHLLVAAMLSVPLVLEHGPGVGSKGHGTTGHPNQALLTGIRWSRRKRLSPPAPVQGMLAIAIGLAVLVESSGPGTLESLSSDPIYRRDRAPGSCW